jgi:hypothetical protein
MIENRTVKFVVRGQIDSRIFDPDCSTDTQGLIRKRRKKEKPSRTWTNRETIQFGDCEFSALLVVNSAVLGSLSPVRCQKPQHFTLWTGTYGMSDLCRGPQRERSSLSRGCFLYDQRGPDVNDAADYSGRPRHLENHCRLARSGIRNDK